MPSNLDILAASDFSRNPFLETIKRRPRGDHTMAENVEAVVEIDSVTAQAPNYAEGGQTDQGQRDDTIAGGRIEVAPTQKTHLEDTWEINGRVWAAIGKPEGEDAGSKTIILREVRRNRGRHPNVNT